MFVTPDSPHVIPAYKAITRPAQEQGSDPALYIYTQKLRATRLGSPEKYLTLHAWLHGGNSPAPCKVNDSAAEKKGGDPLLASTFAAPPLFALVAFFRDADEEGVPVKSELLPHDTLPQDPTSVVLSRCDTQAVPLSHQ